MILYFRQIVKSRWELIVRESGSCLELLGIFEESKDTLFSRVCQLELWWSWYRGSCFVVYAVTWAYGCVSILFQGYERIYNEIPDINLDVPHSYSVLERFVEECFQAGIISKQLRDLCPSRGRKRFVSEGDGGRLKPESY